MRVSDILEHFLSRADWIDRKKTCDRVIAGNPDTDVDRCMVTWMPSFEALRHTADRGFVLLICHEPTFWHLPGDHPSNEDRHSLEKSRYIQDHGLVILRIHDCWDRWPKVGVPWAWAQFLGLGNQPQAGSPNGYQYRYDVSPLSLDTFARSVAQRCSRLGEPVVQVTGDPNQLVSRIGIGTGCACDIPTYQQMDCDCSIVCDDGSCCWAGIQRALDMKHPVIRVNHGTSEEPGMKTMTQYINRHLDGVQAEYLPHGNTFSLVGSPDDLPSSHETLTSLDYKENLWRI